MKIVRYTLVIVALAVVAVGVSAQPAQGQKHLLRYQYTVGQQLGYEYSGTLSQKMEAGGQGYETEATLSGNQRLVTVEVDAESGAALLGALSTQTYDMTAQTPQGEQKMSQSMSVLQAGRLDPLGRTVARVVEPKEEAEEAEEGEDEEADEEGEIDDMPLKKMALAQVEIHGSVGDVLPEEAVAVGESWKYTVPLGAFGMPLDCDVEATLAEVKTEEGRTLAVINGTIVSSEAGEENEFMEGMDLTGTVTVLLDLDRGIGVEKSMKVTVNMDEEYMTGEIVLEISGKVTSVETLQEGALKEFAEAVGAVDAAINLVYQDDAEKAVETLAVVLTKLTDEELKNGVERAKTAIESILRMGAFDFDFEEDVDPDSPEGLMKAAETAANEEKWAEAVAKYRELLEKYPDDKHVAEALIMAASICEERLGDQAAAAELREKLLSLRQEKAAAGADPMETYKLAASYAEAGDPEKAVATYREFLAIEDETIPANRRVMAQWRLAGLLEQLGRPDEARKAYQDLLEMEAEDSYSAKVKERAKAKIEKMGAGAQ